MNKAVQILFELLIVGLSALVGLSTIIGYSPGPHLVGALIFLTQALVAGFVISCLTSFLAKPLHSVLLETWREQKGQLPRSLEEMRDEIYASGNHEVGGRLTYHRAMSRIAGGVGLASALLALLALASNKLGLSLCFFGLAALAVFAVRLRVLKLAEITLNTWEVLNRPRPGTKHEVSSVHPSLARLEDGISVRALIFAGGTAFRNCNIALARRGHRVTRIVPSWDNGGSSRMLRDEFKVLSIGDIRHALMTMAHGENISNEVIRLFNCRLSEDGDDDELCQEMESFLQQKHPRMAKVPGDLRNVILKYLETFWHKRPAALDLKNGSIGNFVMLGAYLAHGNDMNTAIYVFRQLCGINGNVWPVTLENDLQLGAELADGTRVVGEENVTAVDRPANPHRLVRPYLVHGTEAAPAETPANPLVINAFSHVDAIIFGPGSFFSSVLPHLMVKGIVDELARAKTPKMFVGNMLEGNECFGWSVAELVDLFLATCHRFASEKRDANQYLTHIVTHDSSTHRRQVLGDRNLEVGDLDRFRQAGINVFIGDLEDPWKRGAHDANILAQHIIDAAR